MFKLFKKLRCKHEYVFSHYQRVNFEYYDSELNYTFVCKHCMKQRVLSESMIRNAYLSCKEEVAVRKALGKSLLKSSELITKFHNGYVTFEGPACTMLLRSFKKQGIDLTQLSSLSFSSSEVLKGDNKCN